MIFGMFGASMAYLCLNCVHVHGLIAEFPQSLHLCSVSLDDRLSELNKILHSLPWRLTLHPELKVLRTIIVSHTVTVVNILTIQQGPAEHPCHHQAMFKNVPALVCIRVATKARNENVAAPSMVTTKYLPCGVKRITKLPAKAVMPITIALRNRSAEAIVNLADIPPGKAKPLTIMRVT
jgi:hypothetical protein